MQYADDTITYFSHPDKSTIATTLTKELTNIYNQLEKREDRTDDYRNSKTSRKGSVNYRDTPVHQVGKYKHLGVLIDR